MTVDDRLSLISHVSVGESDQVHVAVTESESDRSSERLSDTESVMDFSLDAERVRLSVDVVVGVSVCSLEKLKLPVTVPVSVGDGKRVLVVVGSSVSETVFVELYENVTVAEGLSLRVYSSDKEWGVGETLYVSEAEMDSSSVSSGVGESERVSSLVGEGVCVTSVLPV